jgi:Tfp pilus assembly protein PilX
MTGRLRTNNYGMVSMMVTLIMMLVISMIVLGFAQVSRREQRASLDRQLSTQAFLAAESGVNDARKIIQNNIGSGKSLQKDACDQSGSGPGSAYTGLTYDGSLKGYPVDPTNNVAYTCLLVSTQLNNIHQQVSSDGPSSTIPIHPDGAGTLNTLHIKWDVDRSQNPSPKPSQCRTPDKPLTFPTGNWDCDFGVLRLDIVPTDSQYLNRTDLMKRQKTFFLYPTFGGTSAQVDYGNDSGKVGRMKCDVDGCIVDLTNIDAGNSTNYAVRVSSLYVDGTLDITASNQSDQDMKLADAQALIDATGRAQDILRRIQVRLSLLSTSNVPSGALDSGGAICKRFQIGQSSFTNADDFVKPDPTNPMCQPGVAAAPVTPVTPVPPTGGGCTVKNDIVMALDVSTSMDSRWNTGTKRQKMYQVAKDFVQSTNISKDQNHMAIISFGFKAVMMQQNTDNQGQLISAINKLQVIGGTSYVQPLQMAEQSGWSTGAVRTGVANKVLVFLSDGRPNVETDSQILAEANTLKNKYGIFIYTVGINMSTSDFKILQDMASTGSSFANAQSESDLDAIMNNISGGINCK